MNGIKLRSSIFRALILLTVLIFTGVSLSLSTVNTATNIDVHGVVFDSANGSSAEGAEILVYYPRSGRYMSSQWQKYKSAASGSSGEFSLSLEEGRSCLMIVTHKNQYNDYDFVPYGLSYTPSQDPDNVSIKVMRSATVEVKGLAYFIETTMIPQTTFRVQYPVNQDNIESGSMPISYGAVSGSFSEYLSIPGNVVLVPANTGFILNVISSVKFESTLTRQISVEDFEESGLEAGQVEGIDLRRYSLPNSIEFLDNVSSEIETLISGRERQGFYLAVERQRLGAVASMVDEAESMMNVGEYDKAFTKLREAYIEVSDLRNNILGMVNDATLSVYLLTGFTAVSSTVIAYLVHESRAKKLVTSSTVFTVLVYALYRLHPGSAIVTLPSFVTASILSFMVVSLVAYGLPVFLSEGGDGDVTLRNMVIPVLSVAKRGLRRRWLRFTLTLFSVLLLVTSFISLTSFASGYGLSVTKVNGKHASSNGVMIRTPNPPPTQATAPFCGGEGVGGPDPLDSYLIDWFNETESPLLISAKYQNIPMRQYREAYSPYASLNGAHIFGVMAIDPAAEAVLTEIKQAVVSGSYLGDEEDTAMISVGLASRLNLNVGDVASFKAVEKTLNLTIVALLGDDLLSGVMDLDGDPFVPQKIIEVERIELEGPDHVVEGLAPCNPDEVVIFNQVTGSKFITLWINRIDMTFSGDLDLSEFASKTALTRGFRAWASKDGQVYLAQLAGYFQGKGLPIVVPWIIVILNVVVTMLNSYYERRHEIMIYSSIGMNPRQISSIFLSEAAVIGVIGGCIGYLLGLGAYKLIYLLTPTMQVEQKVSAFWSLAAIGISLVAVLIGGLVALANSTAITPSLKRRWKASTRAGANEPVKIVLPVHVFDEEVDEYVEFLMRKLFEAANDIHTSTKMVKLTEFMEAGGRRWEINFIYSAVGMSISGVYTRNTLNVKREVEGTYSTTLSSTGDTEGLQSAGAFMRAVTLAWSVNRSSHHGVVETNLSHTVSD